MKFTFMKFINEHPKIIVAIAAVFLIASLAFYVTSSHSNPSEGVISGCKTESVQVTSKTPMQDAVGASICKLQYSNGQEGILSVACESSYNVGDTVSITYCK